MPRSTPESSHSSLCHIFTDTSAQQSALCASRAATLYCCIGKLRFYLLGPAVCIMLLYHAAVSRHHTPTASQHAHHSAVAPPALVKQRVYTAAPPRLTAVVHNQPLNATAAQAVSPGQKKTRPYFMLVLVTPSLQQESVGGGGGPFAKYWLVPE